MKSLFLVRHARALRKNPGSVDFDRQLSEEGVKDAHWLGGVFKAKGIEPDLVISSTAPRALKTAKIICETIHYTPGLIREEDLLYEAGIEDLLNLIQNLNDEAERVLIVGHNPTLSIAAMYLTRYGLGNLAPGGLFCCEFRVESWQAVSKYSGIFRFVEEPAKE